MSYAEEQLEAAIWEAMKVTGATVADPLRFIEFITFAAQRYAAQDSEILTELRRRVLERDTAEQTSASTRGGVTATATEQNPTGSVAFPPADGDGGATLSTDPSIPGVLTWPDAALSTGLPRKGHRRAGFPQEVWTA